jgi:hypothetical protein
MEGSLMKKILIYDDETRARNNYKNMLVSIKCVSDPFEIDVIDNEKFKHEIALLEKRRKILRKEKCWDESSIFDNVDILIVDYDLLRAFNYESYTTGEIIAYLVRCFSTCGLIVGLNQYGNNLFDLTLKGHLESYCDLNIGNKQLDNTGLWSNDFKEFRPWYWPNLINFLNSYNERVNEVLDNWDSPICEVLNFDEVLPLFSRNITDFLKINPEKITFREFVLKTKNGLRGTKDKYTTNEMVARIGVARISKWIERWILPGQNILIDAPHLLSRYPSLLNGDVNKIDDWNNSVFMDDYKKIKIRHNKIDSFRYKNDKWISRPVWYWEQISNCSDIDEVEKPWERKETGFVFCEDVSNFYEINSCKGFVIDSDSPFIRRYVKKIGGVDYQPINRIIS